VLASPLAPTVLDVCSVSVSDNRFGKGRGTRLRAVLGFSGAREDVEWQAEHARQLGAADPGSLHYYEAFWEGAASEAPRFHSVLPSLLPERIQSLEPSGFVAHAGNGAIWYCGGLAAPRTDLPRALMRRVKQALDPNNLFPMIEG
jgi:hypothetical protein